MFLAPFARLNEGFSYASLLIYLLLGTGTCSASTRYLCGLFYCAFLDLILQVLLLAHLSSCTLVVQLYHKSVCASVVACCMFAFSCGVRSLCVVAGCAVGSVTILQNACTLSPAILVCLYLGLGQAGINYILLNMVLICQCFGFSWFQKWCNRQIILFLCAC